MRLLIVLFVLLAFQPSRSDEQNDIDMTEIEQQLNGDGLGGWVHASVEDSHLFVFTWRHPENFFVNIQLPLVPKNAELGKKLVELRRHDFVTIKGKFINNQAPIQHILVEEFVNIQPWQGLGSDLDYNYEALPAEVFAKTENTFKIHGIANGGAVVVVEYKDRVYPIFNKQPAQAAHLFRNDFVFIRYKVRGLPLQPTHLEIDYDRPDPLLVIERISAGHGEAIELTGPLVMYPQSPQIIFNIYALQTRSDQGLSRDYTLVNFANPDLFLQLRETLEAKWNEHVGSAEYDRNKFINRKIMVTVKGTKNLVSPNQANPQILIDRLEDVQFKILADDH